MNSKTLKIKYSKEQSNKGFTLIEVLVAVSIFSISITALMLVLGKGIADISVARNKLVANYLVKSNKTVFVHFLFKIGQF